MQDYPKIAYIMSRFPHLPETFILREMNQLSTLGWPISLYPIVNQEQSIIHPSAERWLSQVKKAPLMSKAIVAANGRAFIKNPWRYGRIWLQSIVENLSSPKFLSRTLAMLPKAVYFAEMMQAEGITHVHAHYASHPALMAWIIHQLTGIPYSVTVHAHDIFVKFNMLHTKLKGASAIVAISEYNRAHLKRILGDWVTSKTHIIHCGIDMNSYKPPQTKKELSTFEIINIGSLQPYKGQQYLVQACAILRDQGIPFRCRIIGEGEGRDALTTLINDLDLADKVILLGAQTQDAVMALLPTAHCYAMPSIITPEGKMEGIPVSIMEAFASGLPVIATELSGIPELVQPGKTGYLVPPENAEALAGQLVEIYQNPADAMAKAKKGRALVAQSFELTQNVQQLSDLLESLASESCPQLFAYANSS
ncbi:MAG: glycosyltransferase family 4 protein [Chloroflexi bacterium]|nr:glycosyltransferase family 4 protein [Chloroflexota bacterium]